MLNNILEDLSLKMEKSINVLNVTLQTLRIGRASPNFLDKVMVFAYGCQTPLNQLATVTVVEVRSMIVQVWDKLLINEVKKAIIKADLGITPIVEDQIIRITLPILSEKRRDELIKIAHKYGEDAKIAIRNIRREFMDQLKKIEKNHEISKDDYSKSITKIDNITKEFVNKVDSYVSSREKEIATIS